MRLSLNTTFRIATSTFFLLLFTSPFNAQKFGKIEDHHVMQTVHPKDSSADASYIFKKATAYFDITSSDIFLVIDVHERIKIYNENGEGYGSFNLPLYIGRQDRERIGGLKGRTYNNVNGEIVESKLSKKDVYLEEASDTRAYKKFALPDVKAGSVLDVKYSLRTPYIFYIPTFNFQEDIPVDQAVYEVRIPSYYTYTPVPSGFFPVERQQKEVHGDYGRDIAYTFTARDVPALLEDEFVLDYDDYRSSLKYELYSSQFPNNTQEFYVKDWNEISKDLMKNKYFGKELKKKTKELKPFLESIAGLSDQEKTQEIYTHVQSNYSWDGSYGIGKDEGIKNLIKNKSGNVGDINLLLINLLLQSDINAKPYVTKARHHGLLNENYPSRTELDYLLAYVPQGDSYILLDATSKYAPIGKLPERATNINGLLINGDKGSIINIDNPNTYKSITMTKYDIDVTTPSLDGSGKQMLKDYAASSYRRSAAYNEDVDEDLEEDEEYSEEEGEEDDEIILENDIEVTNRTNVDDINKDITTTFNETIYNEIAKIGDQIFINAAIDFGIDDNPFYEEAREFPVFYGSLQNTRQVITINIPEGYEVESVPEAANMTLEGRSAQFKYSAKELGNSVVIDYTFKINKDFFLPSEYPNLKELYRRVVDKSKEKIVIGKVSKTGD